MLPADAQCVIPTDDLQADILFFTKTLKMRMDTIYPADDPKVAVFSGYGISICIDKDAPGSTIHSSIRLQKCQNKCDAQTTIKISSQTLTAYDRTSCRCSSIISQRKASL